MWPDTLYTTRDTCSSCAVTRTVPDRASDHTYERWFRRGFCIGDSPCRSWKWTVTYRIGFSVSVPLFGVVWTVSCSCYTRYLIDVKGYPVYGVNSVKTLYYNCRKYRIYPNKYHSALIFHASNAALIRGQRLSESWTRLSLVLPTILFFFRIELTELTSFDSDYS